jgi:hypothetical protein
VGLGEADNGEHGRRGPAAKPDERLDVGPRLSRAAGTDQEDGSIVMGITEGWIGRERRCEVGDGCRGLAPWSAAVPDGAK